MVVDTFLETKCYNILKNFSNGKSGLKMWPSYRQLWQMTSDCRPPVNIWSMIQLHWFGLELLWLLPLPPSPMDDAVDPPPFGSLKSGSIVGILIPSPTVEELRWLSLWWPSIIPRQWRWRTLRVSIKNSWASCCSYPAKWRAWVQTRWSNLYGMCGADLPQ